jgi:hypothetical protein
MTFSALAISPGRAEAQFGMGFGGGWGWGFGGFSQVPKPESFLYSKALIDAGRDTHIPTRDAYAHNSNSYINHIRDNGFVERYDPTRRDPSYYRVATTSRSASTPSRAVATSLNVPQAAPTLPLSSFYDAANHIVWPGDAPTAGDLKEKRSQFDEASGVVMSEVKKNGVASIATVTDARQKLLEYGRPGLQYVRAHGTPAVADAYHVFLLSLYESLAQAVNPPPAGQTPAAGSATPAS